MCREHDLDETCWLWLAPRWWLFPSENERERFETNSLFPRVQRYMLFPFTICVRSRQLLCSFLDCQLLSPPTTFFPLLPRSTRLRPHPLIAPSIPYSADSKSYSHEKSLTDKTPTRPAHCPSHPLHLGSHLPSGPPNSTNEVAPVSGILSCTLHWSPIYHSTT